MWSARLIALPLMVVLVWLADLSSGQGDTLRALKAGTPEGRRELAHLLRDENIPFVVSCLIDPGVRNCDQRTSTVKNLVYFLYRSNFHCRVCPPPVQKDIDYFRDRIQSNRQQCQRLQTGLGLSGLCRG